MLGEIFNDMAANDVPSFMEAMTQYSYYEQILQPGQSIEHINETLDIYGHDLPEQYDFYDNTFVGNFATPFAALAHYVLGDGQDINVSIENLGLTVSPNEIVVNGNAALDSFIFDENFVGTKPISVDRFAYNTANDSYITGAYLGNVTLKLEGEFTKFADGSWAFDGEVRGYSDFYDFNASGHRDWVDETFTSVGASMPGNAYDINILGNLTAHWTSSMDFIN